MNKRRKRLFSEHQASDYFYYYYFVMGSTVRDWKRKQVQIRTQGDARSSKNGSHFINQLLQLTLLFILSHIFLKIISQPG